MVSSQKFQVLGVVVDVVVGGGVVVVSGGVVVVGGGVVVVGGGGVVVGGGGVVVVVGVGGPLQSTPPMKHPIEQDSTISQVEKKRHSWWTSSFSKLNQV